MEAGACAACNGDEQCREKHVAVGKLPSGVGGKFHIHVGTEDAYDGKDHHAVKQEGRQVVTGLQQHPDRKQRSYRDIHCNEDDPEGTVEVQSDVQTEKNDSDNAQNTDDGSRADGEILPINEETENESQHNEQQGSHCGCCVCGNIVQTAGNSGESRLAFRCDRGKGSSHNGGEGCDNEDQNGQGEDDEQTFRLNAHGVADNFADGSSAVTNGCKQCTKVMHTAKEDTADHDPQEDGNPSEHRCLNRSVDRAGTGDG